VIQLATPIPRSIVLAVSGGSDSMSLLSFCQRGRKQIKVIHIDHGTLFAKESRAFVEKYCAKHSLSLDVYEVPDAIKHTEEAWRDYRLGIYKRYTSVGEFVATGHTNDDLAEWFIMSSLHGKGCFMKPVDEEHRLLKPFLYTSKEELIAWCLRFDVPFLTDPTNEGTSNARAKLRSIMPTLLSIHPGFKSSIKNKARAQ
jgi:tRNA(Ile)-lysidine synthetase-like protein